MSSIQIHVMSQYDRLSKAEQKAADYFLQNMDSIYSMPIAELASKSDVSAGTWVRFCKSLGFQGLKDLKHVLFDKAREGQDSTTPDSSLVFTDIKDHQSTKHIIESIEVSSIQAIQSTLSIIDPHILEEAANAIFHADAIRIFGVGASSLVGQDLAYKLIRIGMNASFCTDFHIQLTCASTMKNTDLAIIISNSGATKEMIEIHDLVHKNETKTLVITSIGKSPLAQRGDLVLTSSSPEVHHRSGAMSSRIGQLVLIDSLFTTLANKNYREIERNLEQSYEISVPHRVIF